MNEAGINSATMPSGFLDAPPMPQARADSKRIREELDSLLTQELGKYASEDTSLVVFGSLARGEWTSGSDLDWTYLIDGQANSDHLRIAQKINGLVRKRFIGPGATGTFGNLAFSHELIHQIGGQNDTNKNTTQRILLLLESAPIGNRIQAYDRVILGVINRYLEEDTHLLSHDSSHYRVPRFLLNDIVRFSRTMAVDFASKQRDREGSGWGLRNAKLRMSRKLIFASGLLVCFSASLDPELKKQIFTMKSTDDNAIRSNLANHLKNFVMLTPLEVLEKSVSCDVSENVARDLFGTYGEFLTILGDEKTRQDLAELRAKDSRTDATFKRVREISETFEKALDAMFFENPILAPSQESTVSSDENCWVFHGCPRARRLSTRSRNAV
jgi:predicted nucleotidyltransferase